MHEKEVITMMAELFDEEYLQKRYYEAESQRLLNEGALNKSVEIFSSLLNKGMDREMALECVGITEEEYEHYLTEQNAEKTNLF